MGVILCILGVISAIFVSAASRLVADDVKAWRPRITRRLIELAVRRLPEKERERYADEWSAFIDDTPGDLSKVLRAAGLRFAAGSIARETRSGDNKTAEDTIKRIFDVSVGLVLLVVIAPLLLLCVIAIWIESPGPVLVRQTHVGQHGKPFYLFRLRTMYVSVPGELLESTAYRKLRATRVGRFIRIARIDDSIRLVNVLRGDLSLVGPRPRRFTGMSSETIPGYLERTKVKPGFTGWEQLGARDTPNDPETRLRLDQHYIKNRTLWFDIRILLLSLWVAL